MILYHYIKILSKKQCPHGNKGFAAKNSECLHFCKSYFILLADVTIAGESLAAL